MSAIPSPSLSTGPVVPSMMQPESDNATPDTAAKSIGVRNDQRFPRVAFIDCLLFRRKLLSRTGTDPRAIHLALGRTCCDKLHRRYLGGLTAKHLSQYRCRRHYLKQGTSVGSQRLDRNLIPLGAVRFRDIERRRPRLPPAGKITLGVRGTGFLVVDGASDPGEVQPHPGYRGGGTPTVGDGAARLRTNHPADLDGAALDLHAGRRQTRERQEEDGGGGLHVRLRSIIQRRNRCGSCQTAAHAMEVTA